MKSIVLIAPPDPDRQSHDPDAIPLGICSLASMIRDKMEVSIIDSYSRCLSITDTVKLALERQPDIVGISLPFSFSIKSGLEIARGIRHSMPSLPVIFGGMQAGFHYDRILRSNVSDLVVIGEAELTFAELIEKFLAGGINGLRSHPPDGVKSGESTSQKYVQRPLISELDLLPFPSFDLLDGFPSSYGVRLLTSRGCAFACPYCSTSALWGNSFRAQSPEKVLMDIKHLNDTWGIKRLSFADDTFNQDPARAREIAQKLIDSSIIINWGANMRIELLDESDLILFSKAGMNSLFIGLESGSERILKSIKRWHNQEKTHQLIKISRELGIDVHVSFMIGLPDETREDIEATISYAMDIPASSVGFHIFHPLPGSEYGNNPQKYGLQWEPGFEPDTRLGAIDIYAPISTRHLSSLEIIELYDKAKAIARSKAK